MYTTYVDDIYRFILVRVREAALAEDLTAETFMRAWKRVGLFDFKNPRAWLYSIARNLITDHWRRKPTVLLDEDIEIIDERPSNEEVVDKGIQAKHLIKALKTLPEEMQSVVTLRFLQNYSVRDTAEALKMSESNVRVTQYRALQKLRKVLS